MPKDFFQKLSTLLHLIRLWWYKGDTRTIAFLLNLDGMEQFIETVVLTYHTRHPRDTLIALYDQSRVNKARIERDSPELASAMIWLPKWSFFVGLPTGIDLIVSPDRADKIENGTYSLCTGYGYAGKGITIPRETFMKYDAFFLASPVTGKALRRATRKYMDINLNDYAFYEVGYPKSDRLLNKEYNRKETISNLELDINKKTILYAPAFNKGASLRSCGLAIIDTLASLKEYNVICKLPVDCTKALAQDEFHTGGIDWPSRIQQLLEKHPDNLRLYPGFLADPAIHCSDVMVGCVSTINWDFLATGKPVVVYDTPEFYEIYSFCRFWDDPVSEEICNAGRDFSTVVHTTQELETTLRKILNDPDKYIPNQEELWKRLCFNPGKGTAAAVDAIESIVAGNLTTRRRICGFFEHYLGRLGHHLDRFFF